MMHQNDHTAKHAQIFIQTHRQQLVHICQTQQYGKLQSLVALTIVANRSFSAVGIVVHATSACMTALEFMLWAIIFAWQHDI